MTNKTCNVGFVSTRFSGTDGVSLETEKWARTLKGLGHECFYFAGDSDRPEDRSYILPEAHFTHPDILALNADLFDNYTRSSKTSGKIQKLRYHIKTHLYKFVEKFNLDLLIAENALSLPMNIPLGLALTEYIAETYIPAIGHHHDFAWERTRYAVNAADDYLRAAFPPTLPSIYHIVINSFAGRQLALRTGASSRLIPNVMDFDTPPPEPDEYASELRSALSIQPEEHFLLQPTRIVPRKRIELAIELTHRLECPSVLVITHASGDEGSAYEEYLRNHAKIMRVRVVFGSDIINHQRGQTRDGQRIFSLADAYQQADLVTYPSTIEGFGNAFLETIYYSRPIVISTYEIFKTDIQPKGFQVIGFDDFIQDQTVNLARDILHNPELGHSMTEYNFEIGHRFYSYRTLEDCLSLLMRACHGG